MITDVDVSQVLFRIGQGMIVKPRVFIASSVEQIDLAYAAQEGLEHSAECTVWSQGVFKLSRTAMASLLDVLDESDFGLFVLAPDDISIIRDTVHQAVRDNVIFELGLFAGRLGPDRCFLIVPRGQEDVHLPTDLLGLAPATYDADRQDKNLQAALGPACSRVRKAMAKLGVVSKEQSPGVVAESSSDDLCDDPNDCLSLIESWMGRRPSHLNTTAMRFDEVDRELRMAPGSARKHLSTAARRWGYVPARVGKDTVLFTNGG